MKFLTRSSCWHQCCPRSPSLHLDQRKRPLFTIHVVGTRGRSSNVHPSPIQLPTRGPWYRSVTPLQLRRHRYAQALGPEGLEAGSRPTTLGFSLGPRGFIATIIIIITSSSSFSSPSSQPAPSPLRHRQKTSTVLVIITIHITRNRYHRRSGNTLFSFW